MSGTIRTATEHDLDAIDRIYNQSVRAGFQTADLTPLSPAERLEWFDRHDENSYPVYLYVKEDKVLGWASLSAYRPGREALEQTAEISFYVDIGHRARGIGSKLVDHCLRMAPALGFRVLFAIVIDGNEGSIALLKKFGFDRWGYLPEVINSDGELRGQFYLGKIIRSGGP